MTTERTQRNSATADRRRPKRRHKAQASRIAVAGASTTAMFGIVAALGHASVGATAAQLAAGQLPAAQPAAATTTTAPAPVVVVRRVPVYVPQGSTTRQRVATPVTQRTYRAPVASAPVTPAPVTRTRGS